MLNTTQMPSDIPQMSAGMCIQDRNVSSTVQLSLLCINVILGVSGNIVALWIFCFRLKKWNTNTVFLINLVIADFLSLVNLPLMIGYVIRGNFWKHGNPLCRIYIFSIYVNRSASIGLMIVVAIYRYFKVVHPHHRLNHMTKKQACYVLALLWMFVIGLRVPILTFKPYNKIRCGFVFPFPNSNWMNQAHQIIVGFEFFISLAVLIFCSTKIFCILRQRTMNKMQKVRRAILMCLAIIVVFVICFLPITVAVIGKSNSDSRGQQICARRNALRQLTKVSIGLSFLKNALDPIIYCFASSIFQDALISSLPKAMRCCGHKQEPVVPVSPNHTTETETPERKQED